MKHRLVLKDEQTDVCFTKLGWWRGFQMSFDRGLNRTNFIALYGGVGIFDKRCREDHVIQLKYTG